MRLLALFTIVCAGTAGCKGVPLKSEESLPASADAQRPTVSVESLRRFASTTLNSRVEGVERLYSFEGFCLDVAGLWFPHMKKAGLRGVLQQTSGVAYLDVEGQKVQRSPTHFFIAFNPNTPEEIIFDPTYGQFISEASSMNLPKVLVEKSSEIHRVYSRYAKNLRVEIVGDESLGKYNPKQVSEALYSSGQFAKNRTSID